MPFLRKRDTGAVTDYLNSDSVEYQTLKGMRFQSDVTANVPTSTGGLISGETGGTIKAGSPVWEEVSEEDANLPDPAGGRVLVIEVPGAAIAADETQQIPVGAGLAGNLTDVEYVPNGAIPGDATNNRAVTLNEVKVTGTATPARAVTALASRTFDATHSGVAGVAMPLTISQAAFTAVPPDQLEVVSSHGGTGAVDPGGVLYAVYTRA